MPQKPKPTVMSRHGKVIPNRAAPGAASTANRARGMRWYGNPEQMRAAIRLETEDRKAGNPQAGRYTRIVDGLVEEFGCNPSTAKRAIQAMRAYNMAVLEERQPTLIAEMVEQLEEIADRAKLAGDYTPAVAAIREIGKLTGVYAPKKIEVSGAVEHRHSGGMQIELVMLMGVLDDEGKRAFEVVLAQWEAAERSGRLALPEPEAEAVDDDEDEDDEDAPALGGAN